MPGEYSLWPGDSARPWNFASWPPVLALRNYRGQRHFDFQALVDLAESAQCIRRRVTGKYDFWLGHAASPGTSSHSSRIICGVFFGDADCATIHTGEVARTFAEIEAVIGAS